MSEDAKRAKPEEVPVIGYWKIRGLVSPIYYLFEYLGVEYKTVLYEQGDDYNVKTWLDAKHNIGLDFPNLPYMFHGDLKFTESLAIMRYICNTWAPDLLGKTSRDKAIVDMAFGTVHDIKAPITSICYATGDRAEASRLALERMPKVGVYMKTRDFVVGDYVTFVDFFLFEQEELLNWITEGKLFKQNPSLEAHHSRMSALPRFGEFLKSERFMSRPFNNKIARLNN